MLGNVRQGINIEKKTKDDISKEISNLSKKPVCFEIDPGNPTKCGKTCRRITATLTNTGDETAQNVNINLNIINNIGKNLYSHQESLGDITGNQSICKTLTINVNCGFLYRDCWRHKPLTLNLEIIWDGGNQLFTQEFSDW